MAENQVEILVKSRDSTRAGFKSAEAEAEAAGGRIASIFDKMGNAVSQRLGKIGQNLGKGAGIFGGGSGLLAMAAPLGAAGVAMGAFGAIAIPVLTKVAAAHKAALAAQLAYSKATTAAGRSSALQAEAQATAGLTSSQKGLMGQVDQLGSSWRGLENKMSPVIVTVASLAVKLGSALMPVLGTLATAGARLLEGLIPPLTKLVSSPFFAQITRQLGQLAVQAGQVLGPALVGLLKMFLQLFVQAGPAGVKMLGVLLPLIIMLATDLIPVITIIAKVVAVTLQWLQHNHLLLPLLAAIAVAILALGGPIWATVAATVVLIAIGVELYKHWRQIWAAIKAVIADVWGWIKGHWPLLLGILTGPVGLAVAWIVTHWSRITDTFRSVVGWVARAWAGVEHALTSPVASAYRTIMGWLSGIANFIGSIPGMIGRAVNGALGGVPGRILGMIGLEHGGITGAAGGGPRSRLVMAGEHGRELIALPPGANVRSNPDTERLLAGGGGGGGGGTVRVVLELTGGDREFRTWLKKSIRSHGGDPQVIGS